MLDWTPLPPKHLKSQCILCTITLLWTRLFNCTSCRLGKPSFKEIQFKGRNKSTPTPIIVEVHSVKWNWVEPTLQCRPPLPQDNYFLSRIQNLFCTHLCIPFHITIDGQSLCEGMEAIRPGWQKQQWSVDWNLSTFDLADHFDASPICGTIRAVKSYDHIFSTHFWNRKISTGLYSLNSTNPKTRNDIGN